MYNFGLYTKILYLDSHLENFLKNFYFRVFFKSCSGISQFDLQLGWNNIRVKKMILEFLIFIATVLLLHYVYLLWNKDYWEKRGVFCPKSDLLLGNLPGQITGKRNMFYELDDLYQKYKKDHSLIGLYNFRSPRLLIFDPELLRDFMVKYFKYFQANEFTNRIDIKSDPLFGNHSFFLIGDAWKTKRSEVSPAFSNTRVRNLIKWNF